MSAYKICGACIICLAALLCVKDLRENYAHLLRVCASILFFGAAMGLLSPVLKLIFELSRKSGMNDYAEAVMKALGIAFITHITSSLCRDCGETGLATGVESVGKIELVLLALPLFTDVLRAAEELLSW